MAAYFKTQNSPSKRSTTMMTRNAQAKTSGSTISKTAVGYKDLAKLMAHLQSSETIETEGEGHCMFFQTFMATAFTLWLTFEELTQLQGKHIKFLEPSSEGSPYFTISVPFRTSNSLDSSQENVYEIYLQPNEPAACLVTMLVDWFQWVVQHNIRPLQDDDFVFPDIFCNNDDGDNAIQLDKRCSVTQVTTLMDKYARETGLIEHGSRLSTDCLRRGGAQHRLVHDRWLFKAVKWWGGWSDKDSAEDVLKYILDDSPRTEFGDMMSPQRNQHVGRDTMWQTVDTLLMGDRFKTAIQTTETNSKAVAKLEMVSQQNSRKIDQGFKELRREWAEVKDTVSKLMLNLASGADHSNDADNNSNNDNNDNNNNNFIQKPDLPKIRHWKEAIRQWDEGDPKRGLVVPLGKWPGVWRRGNPSFYNRTVIVQEFEHFGRDESKMRAEYGDLLSGRVTDLASAIREKRKERQMQQRGVSPTHASPGRKLKRKVEEVKSEGEEEEEGEKRGEEDDEYDTAEEEGSEEP